MVIYKKAQKNDYMRLLDIQKRISFQPTFLVLAFDMEIYYGDVKSIDLYRGSFVKGKKVKNFGYQKRRLFERNGGWNNYDKF